MPLSPVISRHIIPVVLKLLYASLRISITPSIRDMPVPDGGVMVAFWHGKMITGWLLARTLFPAKRVTAVVSMSEDGRSLADALEQCGFFADPWVKFKRGGGSETFHAWCSSKKWHCCLYSRRPARANQPV